VATHAWPYAVSRDERSGYHAVVVPEFLADARQAYVLEYASKGQTSLPGTVTVREVRGAVTEPLSLAYRVTEIPADRFGPGDHDGPKHRAGRTIRVFDGLVLQVPADQVASLGLTAADLDTVAGITAPALDRRQAAGTYNEAESSTAISVGDMGQDVRLLDLQIVRPWTVPGSYAESGEDPGAQPDGQGPWRPDKRPHEPADARSGRRGLIAAAAVVAVLAGLLVWYLTWLLPHGGLR
jgi:hypothetical protein